MYTMNNNVTLNTSKNIDTITLTKLPTSVEELEAVFKQVEDTCAELDNKFNCINNVFVAVTGDADLFPDNNDFIYEAVKDSFGIYTQNIPEWAGVSTQDMPGFILFLMERMNWNIQQAMSAMLNGLVYDQRWGWSYTC